MSDFPPPTLEPSGGQRIGCPLNWPCDYTEPDPTVTQRPDWRYPSRPDFFVMYEAGGRIDWPSREIDRDARRADGLVVTVCRPMTWREVIWWSPWVQRARNLWWRWPLA